ncbi:ABC transporter ATP-binding protein [Propionibacterium australiense]|uniref:ABC transporter n=1 Tax=Propionibacterium australiense TaxID=119981 RepID=A0A383S525_9ACTN|nr:ABC transporter ATP-binding protein [Propionibacterium australiense]SYZ32494.1 ABC transporter [Propionibacterium australiense]VEH90101.1 Probable siderophore transport system ATP-binding protein YusV [Propionibacterium australiense]
MDAHGPEHVAEGPADGSRLRAQNLTLAYDRHEICRGLSLDVPDGSFTVIVGPNGCGKSTLLRALARLLVPVGGAVLLDGRSLRRIAPKTAAQAIGLLPQGATTPDGITVTELVARGRFPHRQLLRDTRAADRAAVEEAMRATGTTELGDRVVAELSGGQRQRVWVAMALAQETPMLLLDEPTTYLDIAHQIDLLELFAELNRQGRTMVAVLHDLNQAARYATHLVAMRDGAVIARGAPAEVVTPQTVADVFGLDVLVIDDPVTGTPMIVPRARI